MHLILQGASSRARCGPVASGKRGKSLDRRPDGAQRHLGRPNLDIAAINLGYQAATSLALVTHRNRTALISLGIPKLVRFDKIHHQPLLMVLLYLRNRGKSRDNS